MKVLNQKIIEVGTGSRSEMLTWGVNNMEKLLNVSEMAELFGVTGQTVRNWIKSKGLPYVFISERKRYFNPVDIQKWLETRKRTDGI